MPITPFHLLAITPIKAVAPKHFSWSVFALTNIIIDLEPITLYLITHQPRHVFFHTIIGATLVAILCATFGKKWCELAIAFWNVMFKQKPKESRLSSKGGISKLSAWTGALMGAWSHLLLDSLMHHDIKPLSPFSEANPLLGAVDLTDLHVFCLVSGIVGLGVLFYQSQQA